MNGSGRAAQMFDDDPLRHISMILFILVRSECTHQYPGNTSQAPLQVAFANVFVISNILVFTERKKRRTTIPVPLCNPHFITPQKILIHQKDIMSSKKQL